MKLLRATLSACLDFMVFDEFEPLATIHDTEDPTWRKFLGDGAKVKLRAMNDLLKAMNEACDSLTAVEEFNVLQKYRKKLHVIVTVLSSWYKTGNGATDSFSACFSEMHRYQELPPKVEVQWPRCIIQNHFEAFTFCM